jgi:hypothetical protein
LFLDDLFPSFHSSLFSLFSSLFSPFIREIDQSLGTGSDSNGWMYSKNFLELDLGRYSKLNIRTIVRRRRWIRRVILLETLSDVGEGEKEGSDSGSFIGTGGGRGGGEGRRKDEETASIASKRSINEVINDKPDDIFPSSSTASILTKESFSVPSSSLSAFSASSNLPSFLGAGGGGSNGVKRGSQTTADEGLMILKESLPLNASSTTGSGGAGSVSGDQGNNNFDFDYEEDMKMETESTTSEKPPGMIIPDSAYNNSGRGSISMKAPSSSTAPAKRNSWFSFGGGSSAASVTDPHGGTASHTATSERNSDSTFRVKGSTLSTLGKQIKFIENEYKKFEEIKFSKWKENTKPKLEFRILELEKRVIEVKNLMEKEMIKTQQAQLLQQQQSARGGSSNNVGGGSQPGGESTAHLESAFKLEDQLILLLDKLDQTKRELYFPFIPITTGTNGVYLACDDFWLEYISGSSFASLLLHS